MPSPQLAAKVYALSVRAELAAGRGPVGKVADAPRGHPVPVDTVLAGDSPRLDGIDDAHVARLAECAADLPPIVVHRQSMRVIDGMHRLRAAAQGGRELVEVTFFDGSDEDAFSLAVELNVMHGLPLSLSDRKAAARRILASNAALSDRAVAAKTGLSDKTVAAIRARSRAEIPHPNTRLGRDGRVYPIGYAAEGRARAARLSAERPNASLREIAAAAGVSPGIVSDVRKRIAAGEDQACAQQEQSPGTGIDRRVRRGTRSTPGPARLPGRTEQKDRQAYDKPAALERLRSDPAIRDKEAGRDLLRWLSSHAIGIDDLPECTDAVPPHRAALIAALAREAVSAWREFAHKLETIQRRDDA
jgi:ParB-like chromosome segregation protein Spo0J